MLKITTLVAVLVAAGAFASNAEAHGSGTFYASPFFRNQGRQPAQPHCDKDRLQYEEALELQRERRMQTIRAQRAAEAAAEAAAAKRARLLAMERRKAVAAKQATAKADPPVSTAAPKADMLQANNTSSQSDTKAVTTGSLTKTASADQTSASAKAAGTDTSGVCRRYSAAADGLIEVPCK